MIFKGNYLFHLHTQYTDGTPSIRDYLLLARKYGFERVIFLEHIRRNPSYEVEAFVAEVQNASEKYDVECIIGFESKVLQDGQLDIAPMHLALAEVIGIAEHGFPKEVNLRQMLRGLESVIATYPKRYPEKIFVWVHPGLWQKRLRVADYEVLPYYQSLVRLALETGVLIERNERYGLPCPSLEIPGNTETVMGWDAHTLDDIVDRSAPGEVYASLGS